MSGGSREPVEGSGGVKNELEVLSLVVKLLMDNLANGRGGIGL